MSYEPKVNACGSEESEWVPDSFGRAEFVSSCNTHDRCYANCAMPKVECDEELLADMADSCRDGYPTLGSSVERGWCMSVAFTYYQAVLRSDQAAAAWRSAQQKVCECCSGARYYCNCNKTCYDDLSVCGDNCKSSLGCFTGICGPAEPGQCD